MLIIDFIPTLICTYLCDMGVWRKYAVDLPLTYTILYMYFTYTVYISIGNLELVNTWMY